MRIMVLGGGNCQQNFIQLAKQCGHYVIVVDYLTECPAKQFADVHVMVSTFDTPKVLAAAKEYNIDGIVTLGTDQPVLTAAVVAGKLGLHFYADEKLALAVTNKCMMKKQFIENNIPTSEYRLIGEKFSDSDIEGLKFPAVLKPVDSQGQRGIFLVCDVEQVRQHIGETLSFSREREALLERFYRSDEITINGWVDDRDVTIISIVDRVTIKNTQHIGICLCHNFPSVHLQKNYGEIEAITKRITVAFGIENGPIYFQYLIGEQGIKVNEIAMRIGGAYEDITIPIISGIDIAAMLLEYVEQGKCDTRKVKEYWLKGNKKCLSTQLLFCKSGYVQYITPKEELMALPCVKAVYYAIAAGSELASIENATARAGYIIVEGDSFSGMIDNVNRVFDKLEVLGDNGENLVIKYSEYKDKYLFG